MSGISLENLAEKKNLSEKKEIDFVMAYRAVIRNFSLLETFSCCIHDYYDLNEKLHTFDENIKFHEISHTTLPNSLGLREVYGFKKENPDETYELDDEIFKDFCDYDISNFQTPTRKRGARLCGDEPYLEIPKGGSRGMTTMSKLSGSTSGGSYGSSSISMSTEGKELRNKGKQSKRGKQPRRGKHPRRGKQLNDGKNFIGTNEIRGGVSTKHAHGNSNEIKANKDDQNMLDNIVSNSEMSGGFSSKHGYGKANQIQEIGDDPNMLDITVGSSDFSSSPNLIPGIDIMSGLKKQSDTNTTTLQYAAAIKRQVIHTQVTQVTGKILDFSSESTTVQMIPNITTFGPSPPNEQKPYTPKVFLPKQIQNLSTGNKNKPTNIVTSNRQTRSRGKTLKQVDTTSESKRSKNEQSLFSEEPAKEPDIEYSDNEKNDSETETETETETDKLTKLMYP